MATIDAVLVDLGALLVPGRYRRIETAARTIGWDPATLLDFAVGAVVLPPSAGVHQVPDPNGARARADRGEASWAEAMQALAAAINASGGPPWDEQRYWSTLTAGPAAADLADTLPLLAGVEVPVGVLIASPEEFAEQMLQRAPATPTWCTSRLHAGKPEAWDAVLAELGMSDHDPARILIVDDAWGSLEAMRTRGFRTLWLDDEASHVEWRALVRDLAG